mmetsp:Transcript_13264/g.37705  ORF Transcript_13264/g.37705 Transcript_13264/m.37705 type:complete len:546 (+) Transcript_13264:195-1832(+)|eukprot:CAMPEP_0119127910 /NCGR_PEP_ID=MMETSP1310-20130426/6267_1 /TAXON_ID=464262 /ORGANISM="Genus nov. species nov., Strain RCC2339" /LENGTH=545 /DNA_ID=CAMNT_0007118197 /DNA_START=233 /DNA_END=1870 /DNA_ORIENTATION=+
MESRFYDPKTPGKAPAVPCVDATRILIAGKIRDCRDEPGVSVITVRSPIRELSVVAASGEAAEGVAIGRMAMCTETIALEAVNAAAAAYNHGAGEWPRMTPAGRIECLEKYAKLLRERRLEIAAVLQWEICKNASAALKEVDRTIAYIHDTLDDLKLLENTSSHMVKTGGILAQVKRSALGVALIASPYNYPLNETYTTLIPALAMGNTCVLKTPRTGGLCHAQTLEMFAECFPAGVVNIVHGSGRTVFTPIMKSGLVNIFAFIGTHKAAQALHVQHPRPFGVRLALGLDAKNPAFVLPSADLDQAAEEVTLGALSYGGQRCTAIKITFVHSSVADAFVEKLAANVEKLSMGLPWDGAAITPLPEPGKTDYLRDLIQDCEANGAKVVNEHGGRVDAPAYMFPAVLYPCTLSMRVAKEEQFGPVVPVFRYDDISELQDFLRNETLYGQQAAIFTQDHEDIPQILDYLAHHVTRINLNAQCQRGPDVMPFSGRKASATGTLSVRDALRTMSIRVAVATKSNDRNSIKLFENVLREGKSNLLRAELLI